ncbi:MAG: hypothetical protein AAGI34_04660 [Pseudomonadota bacterium]
MPGTVADIVRDALITLRAIGRSETPSTSQMQRGRERLAALIEIWSLKGVFVRGRAVETFTLTETKNTYTWGVGGDWDSAKPIDIFTSFSTLGSDNRQVQELGAEAWSRIPTRQVVARPNFYWHEPGMPYDIMRFDCFPSDETITIVSSKALDTSQGLFDETGFFPGYDLALMWGLAVELAPEYGYPNGEMRVLGQTAKNHYRTLTAHNTRPGVLHVDPAITGARGRGRYDVRSGPGRR